MYRTNETPLGQWVKVKRKYRGRGQLGVGYERGRIVPGSVLLDEVFVRFFPSGLPTGVTLIVPVKWLKPCKDPEE